jgi:hypothetical protein
MKNWTNLLCSLFTAVVLAGCQSSSAEQDLKAKPAPNQEPARLILMATDDTGSYRLWDQAKDIACRIIMQLEPGDIFYLRRITHESYTDQCSIFRLELPRMKETGSDNPFDRKARRLRNAFALHLRALKQEAVNRVRGLKPIGARKTDIFGFLAFASEKIGLVGQKARPMVIIASDLQDNVHWKPEITLSGARVFIVGFQVMKDPKKTQKFKQMWAERLSDAGATRITYLRADERVDLNNLSKD